MAVGFWRKLVDFAKKVWGGIQKGAQIASKYVMPVAKTFTSLLSKSDNKKAAEVGSTLHTGLGKISPIIKQLSGDRRSRSEQT